MSDTVDMILGNDHWLRFTQWNPDLRLNPHYAHLADRLPVNPCGAIIGHHHADGSICEGGILFDLPVIREVWADRPRWAVECWEPLTLSPSILRRECGDHGFIREGKWVPA